MEDKPIMTIDKVRIKTYVSEFIHAMEKVNKTASLFILLFTFILTAILLQYSNTFNPADTPLDIIFVMLLYITVASNVYLYTYFIHKISCKKYMVDILFSIVVITINIIIAQALIPCFGDMYQTSELTLVVFRFLNPIIIWYMVYLTIFGLIKYGMQKDEEE